MMIQCQQVKDSKGVVYDPDIYHCLTLVRASLTARVGLLCGVKDMECGETRSDEPDNYSHHRVEVEFKVTRSADDVSKAVSCKLLL